VSEAAQRIENRLVELHRSMVEVQSPESNPVGNSDGRYAPEGNTSSVIDGVTISRAQSVASSSAKLLWKRAEIASDYSDLNQGLYKQPGIMSEPAVQGRVHPQSDFSVCKGTTKSLFGNENKQILP